MKRQQIASVAASISVALILGACSGYGASTVDRPGTTQPVATGKVAFSIVGSTSTSGTSSVRRSPKYLSLAATSLTIALNGLAPQTYQLANCSLSSDGTSSVCPIPTLTAPVGTDTFVVNAYSNSGTFLLGTATVTANVQAGQTTPIALDLAGSPYSVSLALSNASPPVGTSTTLSLTATAFDRGGYQIIGSYAEPVDVTSSDKSNAYTTLSKTIITGSSDSISVSYNGASIAPPGTVMFSATVSSQAANPIVLSPGTSPPELLALYDGTNGPGGDSIDIVSGAGSGATPVLYKTPEVPPLDLIFENANRAVGYVSRGIVTVEMDSPASSVVSTIALSVSQTVDSLTIGPDGNIYIATVPLGSNTHLTTINDFSPQSSNFAIPLRSYLVGSMHTSSYKNLPFDLGRELIRFDKSGNLWFTGSDGIDEISTAGGSGPATIVATIPYPPSLKSLTDMQFDSANDLFISDTTASQVVKLNGSASGTTSSVGATLSGGYFNSVGSIAIDRAGNLFALARSGNCYNVNIFPVTTATGQPVPSRQVVGPGSVCYDGSTISVYSP